MAGQMKLEPERLNAENFLDQREKNNKFAFALNSLNATSVANKLQGFFFFKIISLWKKVFIQDIKGI